MSVWSFLFGPSSEPRQTVCEVRTRYKPANEAIVFRRLQPMLREADGFIKMMQGERVNLLFNDCSHASEFVKEVKRRAPSLPIVFYVGRNRSVIANRFAR